MRLLAYSDGAEMKATAKIHRAARAWLAAVLLCLPGAAFAGEGLLSRTERLAEQGDAEAQFNLGVMYAIGEYVSRDDREAVKWYRLAATQGHAEAQYILGLMHKAGKGVSQNDGEAVKWYRLAAGHGHAEAQFNLGEMYRNGEGVSRDDREAVKWYRLAAGQGHAVAQSNLGVMYYLGKGVPQDNKEAVKWYRLAATQGLVEAQNNMGGMYRNGEGVSQDDGEAVKWFRLAAEQGYAAAQINLGAMYLGGEGLPQDDGEAIKWWRLAAEQGQADAQARLGWMYYLGEGIPQNYEESYIWLSLAVAGGNDKAAEYRDMAGRELSRTVREVAQREASRRFAAINERRSRTIPPSPPQSPSNGAKMTRNRMQVRGEVLLFSGRIKVGDARQIQSHIEGARVKVITFDSLGGNLAESMEIGRLLRGNLIRAEISFGDVCYSACVVAFAGGVERTPHGSLGVHSFYSEGFIGTGNYAEASEIYEEAAERLEAYLKEMRIPVALLDHMKRVSHEEIDILNAEQVKEYFLEGIDPVYLQTHRR